MRTHAHRQAGFIRDVLWLALIVLIIAVAVLDGLALFNARASVEKSAREAAREARNVYSQTQDMDTARQAAATYLLKGSHELTAFEVATDPNGVLVFTVSATSRANTYAFHYLGYLGLNGWVEHLSHPTSTESST